MKLNNPKPNTHFFELNNKLALFREENDHINYWKSYWNEGTHKRLKHHFQTGFLGEYETLFSKYITDPQKQILEAGCGIGYYVAAFHQRGFNIIGIDYEENAVQHTNDAFPDLDIRYGDITNLKNFPDESIEYYLSFGVLEHFKDGFEKAAKECRRVLASNGLAFISVPYLNPFRKKHLLKHAPAKSSDEKNLSFHQYYFSIEEMTQLLGSQNLEVIETFGYASHAFLTREFRGLSDFWKSPLARPRIQWLLTRIIYKSKHLNKPKYCHMIMFVCEKQT